MKRGWPGAASQSSGTGAGRGPRWWPWRQGWGGPRRTRTPLFPPPPVSGGSGRCYVHTAILDFTLQFFLRKYFLVINFSGGTKKCSRALRELGGGALGRARGWKTGRAGGEPRWTCVRACVREPGRGAGLRGRGGRASAACSGGGGRKGAVAVGEGRVAAARGELLGRSGLGDCVFPLHQWAAVKRLAQSARAGAPNFRLFLFWPEPRFLSLQAQPVARSPVRALPSPCCPAASRGIRTQAGRSGTGVTRFVIRSSGQSARGRLEVHLELFCRRSF